MILWSVLIVGTIIYRIAAPFADGLPNFSPVMAIAFCAAIYSGRKLSVLLPLIALAVSDVILNLYYGMPVLGVSSLAIYGCYVVAALMGIWVGKHKNFTNIIAGTFTSALLFYLVTNSIAWLDNPVYAKNLAGWVQALTTGQPGLLPTVYFFRNSLIGDFVFTLYFVGCMEFVAMRAGRVSLFRKAQAGA